MNRQKFPNISLERRKIIKQVKRIKGREYCQYTLTIPVNYGRELEEREAMNILFLRNEGFAGVPEGKEHFLLSVAPIILGIERKKVIRLLNSIKSADGDRSSALPDLEHNAEIEEDEEGDE